MEEKEREWNGRERRRKGDSRSRGGEKRVASPIEDCRSGSGGLEGSERQGGELGLGCPGTSFLFSTLSTGHRHSAVLIKLWLRNEPESTAFMYKLVAELVRVLLSFKWPAHHQTATVSVTNSVVERSVTMVWQFGDVQSSILLILLLLLLWCRH